MMHDLKQVQKVLFTDENDEDENDGYLCGSQKILLFFLRGRSPAAD